MKFVLLSDTHYGIEHNSAEKCHVMFLDIKKESPDAILHAGDWGHSSYRHCREAVRGLRKVIPDVPVLGVLGNHDYWDSKQRDKRRNDERDIKEEIKKLLYLFADYRIVRMMEFRKEKILLIGWNGWYRDPNPPSRDIFFMAEMRRSRQHKMIEKVKGISFNVHDFMRQKEERAWRWYLNNYITKYRYRTWKKVLVTHFNLSLYDNQLESMSGFLSRFEECKKLGFTHICFGHTHRREDRIYEGIRLLNCGADYGNPCYMTFEI